ncbi:DUF2306 domain-containing protein [Catellatospora bangladeshensis]|uniref:DUF2306 domain-containing protein n=1 Tax=Catellatospora bangladeshensis TaxID=310355 RepID=UPI001EF28327|nr:DUF2306 domain-containing protein [Catellatospora bangladeshensis]
MTRRARLVPYSLVALSLVPVIAGAFRVTQLAVGAPVDDGNARFFDSPVPVVLHIVGATVYCLLGAFQFDAGLRRRRPGWHRIAGRLLIPCGLTAALSGMWMAVAYDVPAPDGTGVMVLRLVVGSVMALSIVLGFAAVRRRDFTAHRAWMMRGYALGIAAGTQAFTHLPWAVAGTAPDELGRFAAMAAGWLINLAVAEWFIWRSRRPVRPAVAAGLTS